MPPVLLRPLLSSAFRVPGRWSARGQALLFSDRIELRTRVLFRRRIATISLRDLSDVRWRIGDPYTVVALTLATGPVEIELAEGYQWHALLSERLARPASETKEAPTVDLAS